MARRAKSVWKVSPLDAVPPVSDFAGTIILDTTNDGGSAAGATFQAAVTTGTSVVLTDTTDGANITFTGALTTPTLTTTANGYHVSLTGSTTTVTNDVNFLNTGTVTLGNGGTR